MATNSSSDFVESNVINYFLRGTSIVSPCHVYVALYTSSTSDILSGAMTEVVASGNTLYRRISASGLDRYNQITQEPIGPPEGPRYWTVENGIATNINEIIFPTCGATTWGTIQSVALVTGSWIGESGSVVYFHAPLEENITITTGEYISFPANSLKLFLQGGYTYYSANMVFNYYLNSIAMTSTEADVRAGLFLVMPDEETGEPGTEVPIYYQNDARKLTGYGRKYCYGTTFWSYPTTGSTSNRNDFTFTISAAYDWGEVEGVVIFDSTHNEMLFKSPFYSTIAGVKKAITKNILKGDSFKFGQGFLKVTLD